jgi:predicted transposase/invertase (TIGR01784 family)
MKFVDPKTDIAFKKIFGNEQHKNVLIEFLNEILQLDYLIVDVSILNGYQAPKIKDLKESLLDIRAKDQQGHEFIVEMQVEKDISFYKRAIYYSSKAYSQQLKKVEQYHRLKPVIFLGILDFTIFDHDNPTSRHLILNQENQHHDLKDLEFNFVELPKFIKTEAELESVSDKWLYFIKNADNLERVPVNANTEALKTAYQIANQYTWNAEDLAIYEDQGMRLGRIRNEIETGRLEGIEQGRAQQQRQTVLAAHQNGLAIELIATVCALSIADVQHILNDEG